MWRVHVLSPSGRTTLLSGSATPPLEVVELSDGRLVMQDRHAATEAMILEQGSSGS